MSRHRITQTIQAKDHKGTPYAAKLSSPARSFNSPLLQFHRMLGNRAVGRFIQAKLTINPPGDVYEREADWVANMVMRMPEPAIAEKTKASEQTRLPNIQRTCIECEEKRHQQPSIMMKGISGQSCESAPNADEEEEETPVMRKALSGERRGANLEAGLSRTMGGGSPLPDETRSFMESRFGYDFAKVRIHTDMNAVQLAKDLNASAFTSGRDVYFNAGRYSPETPDGKSLLAHELTHVVQQRQGADYPSINAQISKSANSLIQCYSLRGFPPKEASRMDSAIASAKTNVAMCDDLWLYGRAVIIRALDRLRYDYVPDLGLCGWTFPGAWYIEVGEDAFDKSKCCYLSSTLAHEASHTELYSEGRARKMECKCFGCSC